MNPLGADGVTPASQLGLDWDKTTANIVRMFRNRMVRQGYVVQDSEPASEWDLVAARAGRPLNAHVLRPAPPEAVEDGLKDYAHVVEHAGVAAPPTPVDDDGRKAMAGVGHGAVKALLWKASHPNSGAGLFWIGHFDLDPYVKPIRDYLRSQGVEALVLPPTYAVGGEALQ